METKTCSRCRRSLPLSEYHADRSLKSGLTSWCKQCRKLDKDRYYSSEAGRLNKQATARERHRRMQTDPNYRARNVARAKQHYEENKEEKQAYGRAYYASHKTQARDSYFKRKYGITRQDYDAMFEEQAGRCAMCKQQADLDVDHNHDTTTVRALLCGICNRAEGVVNQYIQSVLVYWKQYDKPLYTKTLASVQ